LGSDGWAGEPSADMQWRGPCESAARYCCTLHHSTRNAAARYYGTLQHGTTAHCSAVLRHTASPQAMIYRAVIPIHRACDKLFQSMKQTWWFGVRMTGCTHDHGCGRLTDRSAPGCSHHVPTGGETSGSGQQQGKTMQGLEVCAALGWRGKLCGLRLWWVLPGVCLLVLDGCWLMLG
jgi:hypothetical protein